MKKKQWVVLFFWTLLCIWGGHSSVFAQGEVELEAIQIETNEQWHALVASMSAEEKEGANRFLAKFSDDGLPLYFVFHSHWSLFFSDATGPIPEEFFCVREAECAGFVPIFFEEKEDGWLSHEKRNVLPIHSDAIASMQKIDPNHSLFPAVCRVRSSVLRLRRVQEFLQRSRSSRSGESLTFSPLENEILASTERLSRLREELALKQQQGAELMKRSEALTSAKSSVQQLVKAIAESQRTLASLKEQVAAEENRTAAVGQSVKQLRQQVMEAASSVQSNASSGKDSANAFIDEQEQLFQ